jgi:hypothetical protein
LSDGPIENAGNRRGRPFQKGQGGRPKGSRNRRSLLAEKLMSADLEAVTRSVVRAAIGGDMQAARIILDRMMPGRRGRSVTFPLPSCLEAGGVVAALGAVITAVGRGELTIEEANGLAALLDSQRKAIETQELEQRLAVLEERSGTVGARSWPQ